MTSMKLKMSAATMLERLGSLEWIAIFSMRLFVGYFFVETGWGKSSICKP